MVLLLSGFGEPLFSLHFKHRAGFPRSNGGRILRSDLTPEIYPPFQRALFLFLFRSDGPHAVGNFGWDPTIRNASSGLRSFCQCCVAFDHSIFLDLSSYLPVDHRCCTQAIITVVLAINDKLTLPVKHAKHPLHYLF
jgi:hypothetical protein